MQIIIILPIYIPCDAQIYQNILNNERKMFPSLEFKKNPFLLDEKSFGHCTVFWTLIRM